MQEAEREKERGEMGREIEGKRMKENKRKEKRRPENI